MEPIYSQTFHLNDTHVDCFGRLKPSVLLQYIQEVASVHGSALGADYETLAARNLFWAILRTRVQISRLPVSGEQITLKTWPMPTTRVAYPRSIIAYDASGAEIFRAITLWVMMDRTSRAMVIPSKSGIAVQGHLEGNELAAPGSVMPRPMEHDNSRQVNFTDLDINGHMNITRYLDWIYDLLRSSFHGSHAVKEFTICYLAEALEGQTLDMNWEVREDLMQVEATRQNDSSGEKHRVFAAKLQF